MKMVLVFDTEDWVGTRNSLKLAQRFFQMHHHTHEGGGRLTFTKIPLIKLVRQVAIDVKAGRLDGSLRETKQYVESHWVGWDTQ